MGGTRRIVTLVAAVAAVAVLATGLWWRAESNRHAAMQAAVTSFEPPSRVDRLDTGEYQQTATLNPFCVDARCPFYSERHFVAVPDGDRKPEVVAALEALGIGPVDAPSRSCSVTDECLYRIDGGAVRIGVTVMEPSDSELGTLANVPPGHVETAVTIYAY